VRADEDSKRRAAVKHALAAFAGAPVGKAAAGLLRAMGYHSGRTARFPSDPEQFLQEIDRGTVGSAPMRREGLRVGEWRECAFVFQLTNDEIPFLASDTLPLAVGGELQRSQIESLLFVALDLGAGAWSRGELAKVTRALNQRFPNPVVVLVRHGASEPAADGERPVVLSMAVIDRRANLRDGSRDVVERRISIIKDVRLESPHRAHVGILSELAFGALANAPSNFRLLYDAWMDVLSTEKLNKRFYKELSEWFAWASHGVQIQWRGGVGVFPILLCGPHLRPRVSL